MYNTIKLAVTHISFDNDMRQLYAFIILIFSF